MELNSPPSSYWLTRMNQLMADPWLCRKLDRKRCLIEAEQYFDAHFSEVEPGLFIDIGCGGGFLLEVARSRGFRILGVDAARGAGGMGESYLEACRLLTQRQKVPVLYHGFHSWLRFTQIRGAAVCNFRGSYQQCMAHRMIGRHDLHHDCKRTDWVTDAQTVREFRRVMGRLSQIIKSSGILMLHTNGTGSTNSWFDVTLRETASNAGLQLLWQHGLLKHKFVRR